MFPRDPLSDIPVSSFHSSSSSSSLTSRPQLSPNKALARLSRPALPHPPSLLPSPFLDQSSSSSSSTTTTPSRASPLPHRPSAIGTQSPGRLMMERDELLENEPSEFPPTPPRRLLDVFLESAKKSPARSGSGGSGSASASTSASASGSTSRMGSPAPGTPNSPFVFAMPSPTNDEDVPTWEIYEDPVDASPSLDNPPNDTQAAESTTLTPTDTDSEPDLPKENARPSPRRHRSNSLLSQTTTRAISSSPAPSPTPFSPSSTLRPTRPSAVAVEVPPTPAPEPEPMNEESTFSFDSQVTTTTTASSIFPSWEERASTNTMSIGGSLSATTSWSFFGEGVGSMSAFDTESGPSSAGLLPGFALAMSPRKRPSAGGVVKMSEDGEDEEEEVVEGSDPKRLRLDV